MARDTIQFPQQQPVPAGAPLARVLVMAPRDRGADAHHLALNAEDGTLQLLRSGFAVAGIAALATLLTLFALGGVGAEGPRSDAGWLALMVALMCMPFGLLMLLLGGAKWLRNHWLSNRLAPAAPPRSHR